MRTVRSREVVGEIGALSPPEMAVAQSVLYASLFDYPLTLAELRQSLVESVQTPTSIRSVYRRSSQLRAIVEEQDGYFFPCGRSDLIEVRRRREAVSRTFLARHRLVVRLICAMPYVEMAALSGSVAHLNMDGDGDLDLCIVTRGRRVWSVTVGIILLAKLLRRRRTVCANFVIADSALQLDQQDFFTANQVLHLKPLSGLGVYRRLLAENPFVTRFYPNFHAADNASSLVRMSPIVGVLKRCTEWLLTGPAAIVERLCRRAYAGYLRKRSHTWQSPDQVRLGPDCLKLHTHSHRESVLTRFDRLFSTVAATGTAAAPSITAAREPLGEGSLSVPEPSGSVQHSRRSVRHRFSPPHRG